jgi:hypothetical protein
MEKEIYKYNCETCDFHTNTKQMYERHLETKKHKSDGIITRSDKKYPDKCEKCNYIPTSNRSHIQHMLIYHSTKEEKKEKFKHYCEKCDFGNYSSKTFNEHLNSEKHKKMTAQ